MHQHHPKRHLMNLLAGWSVEQLEPRTLLSSVFSLSKLPVFTATSGDINDFKNGPLGNAGMHLADLYSEYKTFVRKSGSANGFESKKEPLLQYQGASVAVTIRTRGTMPDTSTFIHHIGGELIYRDSTYGTVDAWIPISQLTTLSTNGIVANLNPAYAPANLHPGHRR